VGNPNNQAGLRRIETAMELIYDWRKEDQEKDAPMRVFTPNLATQQYDAMSRWVAQQRQEPVAHTVDQASAQVWYVLIEPYGDAEPTTFANWYEQVSSRGVRVRHQRVGVLILETWMSTGRAAERALPEITDAELLSFER
jgi:hypothetical protein